MSERKSESPGSGEPGSNSRGLSKHGVGRRDFILGLGSVTVGGLVQSPGSSEVTIENRFVRYVIGRNGRNLHFTGKQTGMDYVADSGRSSCALARKGGRRRAGIGTLRGILVAVRPLRVFPVPGQAGFQARGVAASLVEPHRRR